jgi:hypothetical protein
MALHWEKTAVLRKWHQPLKKTREWKSEGIEKASEVAGDAGSPAKGQGGGEEENKDQEVWMHVGMRRFMEATGWDVRKAALDSKRVKAGMGGMPGAELQVDPSLANHVEGDPRVANVMEEFAGTPMPTPPVKYLAEETPEQRRKRLNTDPLAPTDKQRTMLMVAMFSDICQTLILRSVALLKRVGNSGQCPRMIDLLRHFGWAGLVVKQSTMEALEMWMWSFVNDHSLSVPTLVTYIELALQRSYAYWPHLQVFMDHPVAKKAKAKAKGKAKKMIPVFVTRFQWSEYHQVVSNFKDPSTFVPSLQFL